MKAKFKVGDKAIIKYTGEIITIRKVVKAAYYCYFFYYEDGTKSDGYYTDIDLVKSK